MRDLAGICGLRMTNASLSLAHQHLQGAGLCSSFGAKWPSTGSDLSWSLVPSKAQWPRAPAGLWHCGVLPAGLQTPLGHPRQQLPPAMPTECQCEPDREAGGSTDGH